MVDFNSNMPLVFDVYRKSFTQYSWLKDDLIQCGSIGLWKACEKFDESKGFAFSTFATKCIRNEMTLYLRKEIPHIEKNIPNEFTIESGDEMSAFDTYANQQYLNGSGEYKINVREFVSKSKCPDILVLWLQGYTRHEIADMLGLCSSNVCKKIRREIKAQKVEESHIIERGLKDD